MDSGLREENASKHKNCSLGSDFNQNIARLQAPATNGQEEFQMAKFDLNDSGVVVIVGSGAGGRNNWATSLRRRASRSSSLKLVRASRTRTIVNDEWESFTQLAWSDTAHHIGKLACGQDFANLPAWISEGGGRLDDPLGRRVAALRRSMSSRSRAIMGACPAPICWTGRSRSPKWRAVVRQG